MKLKAKLWKVFSVWAKIRYANEYGYCKCASCGKYLPWQQMDAGHYIPKSSGLALYFHEKNVHAECRECNSTNNGTAFKQEPYLIELYGDDVISELHALKGLYTHISDKDYEDYIKDYEEKIKELEK